MGAVRAPTIRRSQVNKDQSNVHHDALEFPDGKTVLLTNLCKGQLRPCCNCQCARVSARATTNRMACWVHPPKQKFETLPKSFTEGSKSVGHLPRYLPIQRDPEFFSAYHH